MSSSLVVMLLLSSFQLVRVASYGLTMSPGHVRISQDPQSVTFTCTADVALTGCQFTWLDKDGKTGPLLELSRGSLSKAVYTNVGTQVTGYCYSGQGLGAGDCGVSLQVTGWKVWMVACRVRAKAGGWTYAWAGLSANTRIPLPATLTPEESVVLPGEEARFTLSAGVPLGWCYFYPPGMHLVFDQGANSAQSTGRHLYLGNGVADGECGLALADVSEADNGPVISWIGNAGWTKDDYRIMALIVAHPPQTPILSVVYTDAVLTATCVVHEGRPVANISWVLGDDVIRNDSLDDDPGHPEDEWRWPWLQWSLVQRVTVRLQAKDDGKVLKCVASHVALVEPLEAIEIIRFPGPDSETLPLEAPRITTRDTVKTSTTSSSPCACDSASRNNTADPPCTSLCMTRLLCQECRVRPTELGNTSCSTDEVYELRVQEARAESRTAELVEEQAKVALEAAKSDKTSKAMLSRLAEEQAIVALEVANADKETKTVLAKIALEAAMSSAKVEEARVWEMEARAKNAEEELEFERERRSLSLKQQLQTPQSVQD